MYPDSDKHELLPDGPVRQPAGSSEVHFTSLIVSARPEMAEAVTREILHDAGAEVSDGPHPGKLIVTLETDQLTDVTDFIDRVGRLPGVLNTAMVYHHAEHADRLDDEIDDTEQTDALPVISPGTKTTIPG